MHDPSFLILFALGLLLTGCLSGFLAGLLGVGGGIVIVPVLYIVLAAFDVDPDLIPFIAVGTSLATIIPTSVQSFRAHHARGSVDVALLKWWGPFVAVGVVLGVTLATWMDGEVLTLVFAVVAFIVAAYMLLSPEGAHLAPRLPGRAIQAFLATTIGLISSLMGIGGGTLTVPVLSLSSYPVRRAVGTASVVGLIIAIPGAIGFIVNGWGKSDLPPFSLGHVNVVGFVLITASSMLFAPLGARAAHALDPVWLKRLFGVFLFATSLKMMI
ncbi:sulfite exporter TauE/SafE family protein [Aureimonas sp. AU22]|jgi:uncharacterized protein|uniref:sulfite exporter TauE/SafE family protein n=1 Tax=Aureimonas sp. AU22 TaxID=1638162 RepID=UPI000706E870|nr:sulfite exporter TauE/SafE family protein [Aureimonas sp. AU22]BAT29801.1 hypothetical protein [Aureimonas sp. AU22]